MQNNWFLFAKNIITAKPRKQKGLSEREGLLRPGEKWVRGGEGSWRWAEKITFLQR